MTLSGRTGRSPAAPTPSRAGPTPSPAGPTPSRLRRAAVLTRAYELMRFGMVGGVAFVVDIGLFNLLRFGPGELLEAKPITAKILSVAVATIVSWLGNRFWTFSERRTETHLREFAGFVVVNIGGMAIAVACLGFSHYVLDLRSPLADNISANGVGLVLGMVFRYLAYRHWVFTAVPGGGVAVPSDAAASATAAAATAAPPAAAAAAAAALMVPAATAPPAPTS